MGEFKTFAQITRLIDPPPVNAPPKPECKCCSCDTRLPDPELWFFFTGLNGAHWWNPRRYCDRCARVPHAEGTVLASPAERALLWMPARYRDTDEDMLPKHVVEAFVSWNGDSYKGIGITGPRETGKSRTLYLMLSWFVIDAMTVEHVTASELAGPSWDAGTSTHAYRNCQILGIDGIGDVSIGGRAADRTYELIKFRIDHGRPTCWTADDDATGVRGWEEIAGLLSRHSRVVTVQKNSRQGALAL